MPSSPPADDWSRDEGARDERARGRGGRRRREEPAAPDLWGRLEEPRSYRDEPYRRFPGEPADPTWGGRPPAADDTMPGRGGMPPVTTQPSRPEAAGPPEGRRAARRRPASDTDPGRLREDDPQAGPPAREQPPVPPARRLISLAVAIVTGLITVGLVFGAQATRESYGVVVLGVQVLFVVAWTVASRPPAPRVVAAVGLAAALAADAAAMWVRPASLAPLAYVTAGAFVAGVVGQLTRPAGRIRVTESLGSTLAVVLGVVAFAMLVVLTRHPGGTQSIVALLLAAGGAVMVARLADTIVPYPRLAPRSHAAASAWCWARWPARPPRRVPVPCWYRWTSRTRRSRGW